MINLRNNAGLLFAKLAVTTIICALMYKGAAILM